MLKNVKFTQSQTILLFRKINGSGNSFFIYSVILLLFVLFSKYLLVLLSKQLLDFRLLDLDYQ
ncbi:MAG: hypothetical protein KatS3mg096_457 [Candidatus Parcubacteria bacterium]|nr:MAG: hypothetical protein KatS3mg096_457 [Candidatus Parcubacteria bacterium]